MPYRIAPVNHALYCTSNIKKGLALFQDWPFSWLVGIVHALFGYCTVELSVSVDWQSNRKQA